MFEGIDSSVNFLQILQHVEFMYMSKILHCDYRNFDNVKLPLQTCSRVCVLFSIIQSCKKDNTNISKKKWKAFVRTVSHKNILTRMTCIMHTIQIQYYTSNEWRKHHNS